MIVTKLTRGVRVDQSVVFVQCFVDHCFVSFLMANVASVLWFTSTDCQFGTFKLVSF